MSSTVDRTRWVEPMRLSELVNSKDAKNPKAHDLSVIDRSVGRFGFVEPIALDERTGRIISGHGRTTALAAMRDRGESAPEGIRSTDDGDWLVPVVRGWASRTDTEAHGALIALNRAGEVGGWVDASLLDLLQELEESGDDFSGIGFDQSSIDDLSRYVSAFDRASSFKDSHDDEEVDEEEDDDTDEVAAVPLVHDTRVVNVVYDTEHRADLYALLAEVPWVRNVRDTKMKF